MNGKDKNGIKFYQKPIDKTLSKRYNSDRVSNKNDYHLRKNKRESIFQNKEESL